MLMHVCIDHKCLCIQSNTQKLRIKDQTVSGAERQDHGILVPGTKTKGTENKRRFAVATLKATSIATSAVGFIH